MGLVRFILACAWLGAVGFRRWRTVSRQRSSVTKKMVVKYALCSFVFFGFCMVGLEDSSITLRMTSGRSGVLVLRASYWIASGMSYLLVQPLLPSQRRARNR